MASRNLARLLTTAAILVVYSACAFALPNPQIAWLEGQQDALGGKLLDSQAGNGVLRGYTYDQALGVIAFTRAGETARAKAILDTMADLLTPDGAPACWYASYDYDTGSDTFYAPDGLSTPINTGANAWMLQAICYYQAATHDNSYQNLALNQVQRMEALRNTTPGETYGTYQLRATWDTVNLKWDFTSGHNAAISNENQDDMYAALSSLANLTSDATIRAKADAIRTHLANEAWAPSPTSNFGHTQTIFWEGFNYPEIATDCQSWGVLSQGITGPGGEEYFRCLDWLLDTSNPSSTRTVQDYNSILDVDGFDFGSEYGRFVWPEGTEGVVAALLDAAWDLKATDPTRAAEYLEMAAYFHGQTGRIIGADGGIIYSFWETNPGTFHDPENVRYEAVSSTAWYYFNESGVNPLSAVPEPATISMLAFSALSLAGAAFRFRRK